MTEAIIQKEIRGWIDGFGSPHEEIFSSQAWILRCLLSMVEATSILELGTAYGYSSSVFLAHLQSAAGPTEYCGLDVDSDRLACVQRVAKKYPRVHAALINQDARSWCRATARCKKQFDFIFIDVCEDHYPDVYNSVVNMLSMTGLAVFDNVLMQTVAGWDSGANVLKSPRSRTMTKLLSLLDRAFRDRRVRPCVITSGSGLLLLVRERPRGIHVRK